MSLNHNSSDQFAQMKKNTVDAKGQLRANQFVTFHNAAGRGPRVMFVGNSITLHAPKPEIGWYGNFGMAASEEEKDYVHLLEKRVKAVHPDAAFCICQVASWERGYRNDAETLSQWSQARDFAADIIVFRFIENCTAREHDAKVFYESLCRFAQYLDGSGCAKQIVTTGFWKHPGDAELRRYATERDLPLVELGELGEDDAMKAIGLFEHHGVANHPGDAGMCAIAERIGAVLDQYL